MRVISVEYDSDMNPVAVYCEDDGNYYTFETVRRGEWIPTTNDEYVMCSNCGDYRDIYTQAWWNFCPKCGADMRGDNR